MLKCTVFGLEKDKLGKNDIELLVNKIYVCNDHIDVKLISDIYSLLSCGQFKKAHAAQAADMP